MPRIRPRCASDDDSDYEPNEKVFVKAKTAGSTAKRRKTDLETAVRLPVADLAPVTPGKLSQRPDVTDTYASPGGIQPAEELEVESLKFLSFNLAGLEPSPWAPYRWTEHDAWEYIQTDIVGEEKPDIVHLQGVPMEVRGVPLRGYKELAASKPFPRCDTVFATYVREDRAGRLASHVYPREGGSKSAAPATAVRWDSGLCTANVQLSPGPDETCAERRRASLGQVVGACDGNATFVLGDTQMKVKEWGPVRKELRLRGEKPPTMTFNTFKFYGRAAAALGVQCTRTYYTRFFHTPDVETRNVRVLDERVYAFGRRFHLSPHLPLVGEVYLKRAEAEPGRKKPKAVRRRL